MRIALTLALVLCLRIVNAQFAIGSQTFSVPDAARANRPVTGEVFYPATTAGVDAPVASGQFPVIVFAHGFVMQYAVYNNIWEALVPQGYIMVLLSTEGGFAPSHGDYGQDMVFIKNHYQAQGADAQSPFYQKVATTSAYMGHSMGGGASFLAGGQDDNVTTVVGLAPAVTNPSSVDAAVNIEQPVLILTGDLDAVTPTAQHGALMYANAPTSCKLQVNILGGGHCYFANTGSLCEIGEAGGQFTITREQQQATALAYFNQWFDIYLKGNTAQLQLSSLVTTDTNTDFETNCIYIPTSVTENNTNDKFTIYPNPNNGLVYIENLATAASLTVYNLQGKACLNAKMNADNSFDLRALPNGVYVGEIETGGNRYYIKIITQN